MFYAFVLTIDHDPRKENFMKKYLIILIAVFATLLLVSCDNGGQPALTGNDTASQTEDTTSAPEVTASPVDDNSCFDVPADMDALRAKVIDYFNEMANVKWKTPGQVIDFTGERSFTTKLLYTRATVYYGLPYTSARRPGASLQEFMDYLDETGTYTGPVEYKTIVGGDCGSPRRAWAWGGAIYGLGMTLADFEFFDNPLKPKKNPHFLIPIEGYDFSHYDYTKPFEECVTAYNDINTMCEAYAKLKACDIIGKRWYINDKIEQHIRMVVEDATVVRNGTGSIVAPKSYVVFSEQTSTPEKIDGKNTTWRLGTKISFHSLYSSHYIPMTNTCLAKDVVVEPEMTISGVNKADNMGTATIFKGAVKCNYNIFYTELTVTDESGNKVIYSKMYPYALSFNVSEIPTEKKPADLPAGKYHYTLTATIGFGTKTLVDMDFTK